MKQKPGFVYVARCATNKYLYRVGQAKTNHDLRVGGVNAKGDTILHILPVDDRDGVQTFFMSLFQDLMTEGEYFTLQAEHLTLFKNVSGSTVDHVAFQTVAMMTQDPTL